MAYISAIKRIGLLCANTTIYFLFLLFVRFVYILLFTYVIYSTTHRCGIAT